MNIPYEIKEQPTVSPCRFGSIWKVQANDAYQVNKAEGFQAPGLFLTYEGQGALTLAGKRYELSAGTFIIVSDAVPSTYHCLENNWKFYFLDFSSLAMIQHLQLPVGTVAASGKMTEAIQLCERLIDNLIVQPAGYAYSADILLQELLLVFAREQSTAALTRYPELDVVLFYMHKNIGKPIRVEDMLQMCGLSRTAFFARFRAMTGLSPSAYMLRLKLESAKASLEMTRLSVKEIAAALHFYDEFHFSRLFKKHSSLSPKEYRRSRSSAPSTD
ncbi:AraC family transcriptional regulator [Paenibacillus aestuarii]|uniref:AraC family transcriptional regulator n=1 Tax=Paenibacillus aestuarii TaxID=516965 RepID=A0ABW0K5X4_9BACL|nr:AraC family transcriptional regulator [Paenibacillus aestuarii]